MQPFTTEEIKALAQTERDMDSGKQTFVVMHAQRLAVSAHVMEELGLENGQNVSPFLAQEINKAAHASVQSLIQLNKITSSPDVETQR